MSLTVIKAGILDTIQDTGRYGFQEGGINPGGVMDRFSAQLANCMLGKKMDAPVFEIHYPALKLQFNEATIVSIAGADFCASIDHYDIPLHRPAVVNKNTTVEFKKAVWGSRCYLSVLQDLDLVPWLDSHSTNLKAGAGGFEGRALKTGDKIHFQKKEAMPAYLSTRNVTVLPWYVQPAFPKVAGAISVLQGKEWDWLSETSKEQFTNSRFTISNAADRMGYRLNGVQLQLKEQKQLVSCGVCFGSIQLLPDGQMIILMADHQTTGGYPVIANVISSHLPALAQSKPGDALTFKLADIKEAEKKAMQQHVYLQAVQHASSFKIENLFR